MDSDSFVTEVGRRLQRERWLLAKAARQRLARLAGDGTPTQTIFVSGLPRSGTNMLMDAYEGSYETQVFHESDPRAFDTYHQREEAVLHDLVERSPARVVVIKALVEGHRIRALLDAFPPARAVWMFRHFDDAINSNMVNWPGGRNQIDDIVRDRNSADWRGLGMTDATHELVRRHYAPQMNDASALALFFCYRHQLLFDQGLDADPRVYLMSYEELVASPRQLIDEMARFSGLTPTQRMSRHIHAQSLRRRRGPEIAPEIRALAEGMYRRLQAARLAKHGSPKAA